MMRSPAVRDGDLSPEEIIRDIEVQISRRVEKRYHDKLELLKRSFEDRLKQIADTLAIAGSRVAVDPTLSAMAEDPVSKQFVQVRAAEILQEELSLERERLVSTLTQQVGELKSDNAELLRVNRELGERLQHHDQLVAADIQSEATARVEAEKRLVQLQHELSMLRLEKTRVDDELSATKAKTVTLAARDKAAHEAERLVQKHADALEEYRIREERATIEHRASLDRLSAEMAQTQNNLADSQRALATQQRELDACAARCASADQQLPALKEAVAARDRRLTALEDKRVALVDKCTTLSAALERSERERNELRQKYISIGDRVDELLKSEEAESTQAIESMTAKMKRLRDALVEERRLRKRERSQLQAETSDLQQKLTACHTELRAAEDAVRSLQTRLEQAETRSSLERRAAATAASCAAEHIQHLETELKQSQQNAAAARVRAEQTANEREAALMRAETALELKTRRADDDLLAAQRTLESRVDTEARKLQQRYQLDMESKLADVRAGYEARLAMEKAREVAAREQAEQKLRDMEAAALEARTLAVEARAVAVQTQCMREKTEALRRAESDHAQAMAALRERSASDYQSATEALRAQLRHAESVGDAATARAATAETAALKAQHAAAELRSRVDLAESTAAEESTARRSLSVQFEEAKRALELVRAQFDAESSRLRALERKQRLEIDDRVEADEAVVKARKHAASAEADRKDAVQQADKATAALNVELGKREDLEKRLERALEALSRCESEKQTMTREADAAMAVAVSSHQQAASDWKLKAQRLSDSLEASEHARNQVAAALSAAETSLSTVREELAVCEAAQREHEQRAMNEAESRVKAAENRVASTSAHADAVGLKAEQAALRAAQLERELLMSNQALARVRAAAEASRRLFAAVVGKQLQELRAECTALRAAQQAAWPRVGEDAERALNDLQFRARSMVLKVVAEHEQKIRVQTQQVHQAAEEKKMQIESAALASKQESESRSELQMREVMDRFQDMIEAERQRHGNQVHDMELDAAQKLNHQAAEYQQRINLVEVQLQRSIDECAELNRQVSIARTASQSAQRAAEQTQSRCASIVLAVAGECSLDLQLQRDLLLQNMDTSAAAHASSDDVAAQLIEVQQRELFASAVQRLRSSLRQYGAAQAAAFTLQIRAQEDELKNTRAQLTTSIGAQRDADDRMQALRRQLAESQMLSEQRTSSLEQERIRLAEDRRAAAADVARLKSEMQTMQQELMLAAELSSVNATQPYKAEVDSLRTSVSSLEQTHRQQLEAKDAEYSQRLVALRAQYEAELRSQRQALSGTDEPASEVSDHSFDEHSADSNLSISTEGLQNSLTASQMRLLTSPAVRANYPPRAQQAETAAPMDSTMSASQLSMGLNSSTLGLGTSGFAVSTTSRTQAMRISEETARLRALTAAVSGQSELAQPSKSARDSAL